MIFNFPQSGVDSRHLLSKQNLFDLNVFDLKLRHRKGGVTLNKTAASLAGDRFIIVI